MAFDWLTGNNLPQFWKNYVSLFDNDEGNSEKRYVVFDMETTGQDWKEDVILSIGAIGLSNNSIAVGDFFEVVLLQEKFSTQPTSQKTVIKESAEKVVEAEAMIRFLNFIKDSTLVGHNINLDIEMLNFALKRLDLGRVRNQFMDTNVLYQRWKNLPEDSQSSLDEVCDMLKVKKNEMHTASGNAYITSLIFLKLRNKLGIRD
ncbi:PolC-type DNA polymerase III [Flavobacterium sp. AG291]|uniref:3'-5' exonuclease n=1 Tax=Flavobacterium sp. AG291 TaxID=2184000 RepID=UPI000E0C6BA5|nr:3'-5' exonuclease [Flavobacterium sp. AG291]RDI14336.1 DNA polymerase-3 subunit epsilon [Flavobacterium sp. AG291]